MTEADILKRLRAQFEAIWDAQEVPADWRKLALSFDLIIREALDEFGDHDDPEG